MTVPIDTNVSLKPLQGLRHRNKQNAQHQTKTIPIVIDALGTIAKGVDCIITQKTASPPLPMAEIKKISAYGNSPYPT